MYLYTHLNVNVNIDAFPKTNMASDFLPPQN